MKSLHKAIDERDEESIRAILATDARQVEEQDAEGNTPLHIATELNAIQLVDLLLKSGSDINAQGQRGWTPIHIAAYYSYPAIGHLLLRHGAKVNIVDAMDNFPISYTARNRSIDNSTMLGLLLHYGAEIDFRLAVCLGMTELVRVMLDNKPDLSEASSKGSDYMSDAVETGKVELVELLIARGFDVNVSLYAPPPLVVAAHFGLENNLTIAKLLLQNGADPQVYSTVIQQTPLEYVLKAQNSEAEELFRRHLANKDST